MVEKRRSEGSKSSHSYLSYHWLQLPPRRSFEQPESSPNLTQTITCAIFVQSRASVRCCRARYGAARFMQIKWNVRVAQKQIFPWPIRSGCPTHCQSCLLLLTILLGAFLSSFMYHCCSRGCKRMCTQMQTDIYAYVFVSAECHKSCSLICTLLLHVQ